MNRIEFLANLDKYKGEDHSAFLQHYGILGQKWGQRRWQNADGTFNTEGKIRYFGSQKAQAEKMQDEKVGGFFDTSADIAVRNAVEENKQAKEKGIGSLLYQNLDGTLTKKGKKLLNKYRNGNEKAANKINDLINMDLYEKTVPEPIRFKNIGLNMYVKTDKNGKDNDKFEFEEDVFRRVLNDKEMAIAKEHRDEIEKYIERYLNAATGWSENGETIKDVNDEIESIEDKKLRNVINAATACGFIQTAQKDAGEGIILRFEGKFGSQPGSNKAKEETDSELFTKKNEKGRSETADKMEDAAKEFHEDGNEKLAEETEKTAQEMRDATKMTPDRKNMTKEEKKELRRAVNNCWKTVNKGAWVSWFFFGLPGYAVNNILNWALVKETATSIGIDGKSKTWSAADWDKITNTIMDRYPRKYKKEIAKRDAASNQE